MPIAMILEESEGCLRALTAGGRVRLRMYAPWKDEAERRGASSLARGRDVSFEKFLLRDM